jgi:hypothetical protein
MALRYTNVTYINQMKLKVDNDNTNIDIIRGINTLYVSLRVQYFGLCNLILTASEVSSTTELKALYSLQKIWIFGTNYLQTLAAS